MSAPTAPRSPCISVCVLDADDLCQGCYRSAAEIAAWFAADAAEKREILRRARERRARARVIRLD